MSDIEKGDGVAGREVLLRKIALDDRGGVAERQSRGARGGGSDLDAVKLGAFDASPRCEDQGEQKPAPAAQIDDPPRVGDPSIEELAVDRVDAELAPHHPAGQARGGDVARHRLRDGVVEHVVRHAPARRGRP